MNQDSHKLHAPARPRHPYTEQALIAHDPDRFQDPEHAPNPETLPELAGVKGGDRMIVSRNLDNPQWARAHGDTAPVEATITGIHRIPARPSRQEQAYLLTDAVPVWFHQATGLQEHSGALKIARAPKQ